MNAENQLIQAITSKPNFAGTSKEDWQQLLQQYPAFGVGQYLYAKKLTLDADPAAEAQRQLAAVHFNDLRWLDYLLSKSEEQLEVGQDLNTHASAEAVAATAIITPDIAPIEQPISTTPTQTEPSELETETAKSVNVPEPEPEITAAQLDGSNAEQKKIETTPQKDPQLVDAETVKPVEVPEPEPEITAAQLDVITAEKQGIDMAQEKVTPEEGLGNGLDNHRLSSLVSAQLADFKKPVTDDVPIGFKKEPLYKTDYFASQGIILGKSQDELGKKVKKFTDWLKDMKQTGQASPQLQTTKQEELQIIQKAAVSLQPEAVLTESMAEVLLQQGKRAQAMDVYQKLSLLYPEKTAYFASKIDSLQQ